jgi:antirestriction protein ArdC
MMAKAAPKKEYVKRDLRQEITDSFIEMLEQGTFQWKKGWTGGTSGRPLNATTGNNYRGGNSLILMMAQNMLDSTDNRWATYKQAEEAGWQVRKGSKAISLEKWIFPEDKKDGTSDGKPVEPNEKRQPFATIFSVFHASQIDGIPPLAQEPAKEFNSIAKADELLKASGAKIEHSASDRAFYHIVSDDIHLPHKSQFKDEISYYGTALHELGHWTGAASRLNRPGFVDIEARRDKKILAAEELIAEITSTFLQSETGIPPNMENHASYVDSWIQNLKDDKNALFKAATEASKAADFVLDLLAKHNLLNDKTLSQNSEVTINDVNSANDAHLTNEAKFKSDIPSELWLQNKKEESQSDGINKFGVLKNFGPATGTFDRDLFLPVSMLVDVPGERGEQNSKREDSLSYIRENWATVSKEPLYLEIDPMGKPWVSEGNHRIMVASEIGVASLPVMVKYFTGGEISAKDGWKPMDLVREDMNMRSNKEVANEFGDAHIVNANKALDFINSRKTKMQP